MTSIGAFSWLLLLLSNTIYQWIIVTLIVVVLTGVLFRRRRDDDLKAMPADEFHRHDGESPLEGMPNLKVRSSRWNVRRKERKAEKRSVQENNKNAANNKKSVERKNELGLARALEEQHKADLAAVYEAEKQLRIDRTNALEEKKAEEDARKRDQQEKAVKLRNSQNQDLLMSLVSLYGFIAEAEVRHLRDIWTRIKDLNEELVDYIKGKFNDRIILLLHGIYESMEKELLAKNDIWVEQELWDNEVSSRLPEEFPDLSFSGTHYRYQWTIHGSYMGISVQEFFVKCMDLHREVNSNNYIAKELIKKLVTEGDELRAMQKLFDADLEVQHPDLKKWLGPDAEDRRYQLIEAETLRELFRDILDVTVILDVRPWSYTFSDMGFSRPAARASSSSSEEQTFFFYGISFFRKNSGCLIDVPTHRKVYNSGGHDDCSANSLVLLI